MTKELFIQSVGARIVLQEDAAMLLKMHPKDNPNVSTVIGIDVDTPGLWVGDHLTFPADGFLLSGTMVIDEIIRRSEKR